MPYGAGVLTNGAGGMPLVMLGTRRPDSHMNGYVKDWQCSKTSKSMVGTRRRDTAQRRCGTSKPWEGARLAFHRCEAAWSKQQRKRWIKLDGPVNKGPWSEEEDQRLREAVWQHSTVWTEVARAVGTRHADQAECTKRWLHFLSPDLDHSEWTEQDDERLLVAVDNSGHCWRKIVDEVLEGRSATDAKNRYNILQQRSKRNSNSSHHGAATTSKPSRRKYLSPVPCKGSSSAMDIEAQNNCAHANKPLDSSMGVMNDFPLENVSREEIRCLNDPFDAMFTQMASSGLVYPTDPMSVQQSQQQQQQDYPVMAAPNWQAAQMPPITQNHHPFQHKMPQFGPDFFTNEQLGGQSLSLPNPLVDSYMDMACTEARVSALLPSPPPSVIPSDCFSDNRGARATAKPRRKEGEEEMKDVGDVDDDDDDDDETIEANEVEAGRTTEAASGDSLRQSVQSDKAGAPEPWTTEQSSNSKRKSTMVLQNMKPDLVGQVMTLLFSSESVVDVKIFSQD